jgi:putative SOS response-associated peptidase YedK
LHLLRAAAPERLRHYSVSTAVNTVRNNGPELIEPAETTLF